MLAAALFVSGCVSIAELTNPSDAACNESLSSKLAEVLVAQGEAPPVASDLADDTAQALASGYPGPRPFLVSSPSGADYTFFVQRKRDVCLLRLYGRRKGFVSYTNNLTYIATRSLAPCRCAE